MSVTAATYNIEADVYTWWEEDFVLQEQSGEEPPEPIDLTGKDVTLTLADGTVLKSGAGLTIVPKKGEIHAEAYVIPALSGAWRLDVRVEGETEPEKAKPTTYVWGKFVVLSPPQ